MSKDRRIDDIAKALGADQPSSTELADVLAQARANGSLFTPTPIASSTLAELEGEIARLQAIKRPSAAQKSELVLARAKWRAGSYANSPAERWRNELLVCAAPDPLVPPEPVAPLPADEPQATEQQAQPPADSLPHQLRFTPLNPDPEAEWRK